MKCHFIINNKNRKKRQNSLKFPVIPAPEFQKFPGIPAGNFGFRDSREFPGIGGLDLQLKLEK